MLQSRNLGFTFDDINCRLCAKIEEEFYYFEGEEDFAEILTRLNINDESAENLISEKNAVGE